MPKYFDIHSHLNLAGYEADWEDVVARLREAGTHTIVVGVDLETSKKAVELAEIYPEIYACIGVHPIDHPGGTFDAAAFEVLVRHPKTVAVGECGFDFFHADKAQDFGRQAELFNKQIDFALAHDKPLMIHARNAYPELLEVLERRHAEVGSALKGNVHFFAGTLPEARRFWALGFSTSFTGVVTFTSQYDEVVKEAPIALLQAETDAPYVAPTPYRGARNEPAYVKEIYARLASIRGEDPENLRLALVENALRMIG